MLNQHIIATAKQKVLSLLAKFSDNEFYERQIARKLGISYGSANRAVNNLYSTGAIRRRHEGRMYFYSVDTANPAIIEHKKLTNIILIEPLVEELKNISSRIVLYGSCAQGTDTSQSDLDLFVVSDNREQVAEVLNNFSFPLGYEDVHIQLVTKSSTELLQAGESEQTFLEEVEQGIILWERVASEQRV